MQVLVVDDHPLLRSALKDAIRDLGGEVDVIEGRDAADALRLAQEHPGLDLVLLDYALPDADGAAVLTQLKAAHPTLPVIVISGFDGREIVTAAMNAGASGFISKGSTPKLIVTAIRLVLDGGKYVPETALPGAATAAGRVLPLARPTPNAEALARLRRLLTPQELRVLGLLLKGYSNKEIARAIGKETHAQRGSSIAESTVKAHMTNILRALGVERRTQAALAVERLGVHADDLLGGEDKA
jgi:DNA-binding NarL/FixJ family response regulator